MRTISVTTTPGDDYRLWRVCAWAGFVFIIGYLITWGIIGYNIPTNPPNMPINDLYKFYTDHNLRIRTGMLFSTFFGALYLPFSCVVASLMRRIEGPNGPMSTLQLTGGIITVVEFIVPGILWLTAAYHVNERTPEIVRMLHDSGWMLFDAAYVPTSLEMLAIGYVFLSDKRAKPLIPRWISWLSIIAAFMLLPLTLLPFYDEGPFAWSGWISFWVSLGSWNIWFFCMSFSLFGAIRTLEQEDQANSVIA